MWIVKDEELGHPFVSDLASESDDEFDAGSDEVCITRSLGKAFIIL